MTTKTENDSENRERQRKQRMAAKTENDSENRERQRKQRTTAKTENDSAKKCVFEGAIYHLYITVNY